MKCIYNIVVNSLITKDLHTINMLVNQISVRWNRRTLSPAAITFLILVEMQPSRQQPLKPPKMVRSKTVHKDLFILS